MKNIHCPMIHGGLQIDLKMSENATHISHCCLRGGRNLKKAQGDLWKNTSLIPLRELNKTNQWDSGCWTCQGNEAAGITSFRTGMLEKFGIRQDLSGPQRLDLMFDIGCNLACRTCGPVSSTFWQKHLKLNNIEFAAPSPETRINDMIKILQTLDLSNLEMIVFCGGETLLGQGYWRVAEELAKSADPSKMTLSFQTNGTQPILESNYKTIEKFHLVKLNISLDGIGDKFEYLRWPASWNQVVDNIFKLKDNLPVNTMFLIEETISIFNLYYQHELGKWVKENYNSNRLGDITNHTKHVANGIFALDNITQEYIDNLSPTLQHLIKPDWQENPSRIRNMIQEIDKFDKIRNQNWHEIFPEVAEFYSRYL